MKKIEKMSIGELRGEVRRHRLTIRYIASGISGQLAQTYISIARDAEKHEEKMQK